MSAVAFVVTAATDGISKHIGWFALVSCLGGGAVFNFEVGRLLGFVSKHVPEKQFPKTKTFEALAFFHPKLLHEVATVKRGANDNYSQAVLVYRSSYLFSVIALFLPLLLAWIA